MRKLIKTKGLWQRLEKSVVLLMATSVVASCSVSVPFNDRSELGLIGPVEELSIAATGTGGTQPLERLVFDESGMLNERNLSGRGSLSYSPWFFFDGRGSEIFIRDSGKLVRIETRDIDGNLLRTEIFTAKPGEREVTSELRDEEGKLLRKRTFEVDVRGSVIGVKTFDGSGPLVNALRFTYSGNGTPIERRTLLPDSSSNLSEASMDEFTKEGLPPGAKVVESDSLGNWTQVDIDGLTYNRTLKYANTK